MSGGKTSDHGISRDNRGEEQPTDKQRAQGAQQSNQGGEILKPARHEKKDEEQ